MSFDFGNHLENKMPRPNSQKLDLSKGNLTGRGINWHLAIEHDNKPMRHVYGYNQAYTGHF